MMSPQLYRAYQVYKLFGLLLVGLFAPAMALAQVGASQLMTFGMPARLASQVVKMQEAPVFSDASGNAFAEYEAGTFDVRMYPPSGAGQFSHAIEGYGTEPSYPVYYGRRARGTKSAPTAAQAGDHGLVIGTRLYGATGFPTTSNVALFFTALENQTDSAQGGEAVLETTATGTASSTRGVFSRFQRTSATQHNLLFGPTSTATDVFIGTQTVDASDTGTMTISAADSCAANGSRSACAIFGGDNDGTYPGQWNFFTGGSSAFSDFNIRLNNAASEVRIKNSSDTEIVKIAATGEVTSAGTSTLGWAVVDGTDNTACTSQCTFAAVFGLNLAAGATAPVIVGPTDATADICLCAGAS